jgi:TolB-like protein
MSIAVIPFRDVSGQPASANCAVAVTDELIHVLMRTEGCRVASASSSAAIEGFGSRDLPDLARKMGVQIFFEGSVRQEGRNLRITARLVTSDGFQLWSQRFDTEPKPDDLFAISDQIVRSLVNRTRPEISAVRRLRATADSIVLDTYPAIREPKPCQMKARLKKSNSLSPGWKKCSRPGRTCPGRCTTLHNATFRQYSLFLVVQARFEEAWHYLQKAQDMDPLSGR